MLLTIARVLVTLIVVLSGLTRLSSIINILVKVICKHLDFVNVAGRGERERPQIVAMEHSGYIIKAIVGVLSARRVLVLAACGVTRCRI